MEIDIKRLCIVHQKDKVIKIFDDSEEGLKFADKFEKEYNIKLSCDPLCAFLVAVSNKGFWEGAIR